MSADLDFEKAEQAREEAWGNSDITEGADVAREAGKEAYEAALNAQVSARIAAAVEKERERIVTHLEAQANGSLWMRRNAEKGYREAVADIRKMPEAP